MKTETTIIMIDEDDAVRQRSWRPTDKLFFLMSDLWRTLYRTFCYRKKIKGHVLLEGTDRYNVRDNWPILILFSHDHIGLSF